MLMAVIFRGLKQKRHWDPAPWVPDEDVQADAAKCLTTTNNKLSVFLLEEPDDQIERVVAAIASTRDHLTNFDLAFAPNGLLERCDIDSDTTHGQTPDAQVNEWHRDLVELTLAKIAQLAAAIRRDGRIQRYSEKNVGTAIRKSVEADFIPIEQINPKLVPSLRKRGYV